MRLLYGALFASSALIAQGVEFTQGVEGNVIDSVTGTPLGGAKVTLTAGGQSLYQTITDDKGDFRIRSVRAGLYTAGFSKPEFLPSPQETLSVGFNAADSVRLRGRLTRRSRVTGHVFDADGRPVPGAELLLDGSLTGQTATSDEEGHFVFWANPGSYVLSARPPGTLLPPPTSEDEHRGWAHTYYPGVLDRHAAVKIAVHAGLDAPGQDIVLRVTRLLCVRGTVLLDNGDPALQAHVHAVRIDETLSETVLAVSNDDGSFEFPSLPEGEWQVSAETEGGGEKLRAFMPAQVAGRDIDRLELRLTPPFAVTGSVAFVQVERAKPERRPVGIFLQSFVPDPDGLRQATTDANGNFRIDNVHPGRYKIVAVSPGQPYFLNSVRMGNVELLGQYVDLASSALPVEIQFESTGGGVRGMVEGCGGGTVVLAPRDSALRLPQFVHTTKCRDLGQFEIPNVRPGDYFAFAFDQWGGAVELLSTLDPTLVNKAVRVRVERGEFSDADLRITSLNQ